jgi:hypothetical protein
MSEGAVANDAERDLMSLWQSQPEEEGRMTFDQIRQKVDVVDKERRRRAVGFYACAAIIVPSWLAVMWFLPDLRIAAAAALATAFWLVYQVHRRSAARLVPVEQATQPGLVFYRGVLERERDFHRGLPMWFVPPVTVSTAAIVAGFLTTQRFAHTAALFGVVTWIISGTAVALVLAVKKSRRAADRLQHDIDALRE